MIIFSLFLKLKAIFIQRILNLLVDFFKIPTLSDIGFILKVLYSFSIKESHSSIENNRKMSNYQ